MPHQLVVSLEMQSVPHGFPFLFLEEASFSLDLCPLLNDVLRNTDSLDALPAPPPTRWLPWLSPLLWQVCTHLLLPSSWVTMKSREFEGALWIKFVIGPELSAGSMQISLRTFSVSWDSGPRGCASALSFCAPGSESSDSRTVSRPRKWCFSAFVVNGLWVPRRGDVRQAAWSHHKDSSDQLWNQPAATLATQAGSSLQLIRKHRTWAWPSKSRVAPGHWGEIRDVTDHTGMGKSLLRDPSISYREEIKAQLKPCYLPLGLVFVVTINGIVPECIRALLIAPLHYLYKDLF